MNTANEAHLILYSCCIFFTFFYVQGLSTLPHDGAHTKAAKFTRTHIVVRDICASCYFAGHCLRFDNTHTLTHTHHDTLTRAHT